MATSREEEASDDGRRCLPNPKQVLLVRANSPMCDLATAYRGGIYLRCSIKVVSFGITLLSFGIPGALRMPSRDVPDWIFGAGDINHAP